jgi:hypothetical protein
MAYRENGKFGMRRNNMKSFAERHWIWFTHPFVGLWSTAVTFLVVLAVMIIAALLGYKH